MRPTLPLPSKKGWIVSNCRWARAIRTSVGSPSSRAWRKSSRSPMHPCTALRGGGTKVALPGLVPPIQFCDRRKCPGSLSLPRPPDIRTAWISRTRRFDSGNPPSSRRSPCSSAATWFAVSMTSSSGAPGASPISSSTRSDGDDRTPSIRDENIASRRMKWSVKNARSCGGTDMPSRRPRPIAARSRLEPSGPSSASAGLGGSGSGTKARTRSPPATVTSYLPVGPRCMSVGSPPVVSEGRIGDRGILTWTVLGK